MAAGAIAEKYLKEAYGVEIVAFVGSVGRVALPFTEGEEEVLGREYLSLLRGVTREEVDKEISRCPHKETSAKMEEVSGGVSPAIIPSMKLNHPLISHFTGDPSRQSQKRLVGRHHHLCRQKLSARTR